jgi:hypothetical protein
MFRLANAFSLLAGHVEVLKWVAGTAITLCVVTPTCQSWRANLMLENAVVINSPLIQLIFELSNQHNFIIIQSDYPHFY